MALRGDPPRTEEYATAPSTEPDFFQHADDLVRYIRQEHGDYFCIGVAGYPTPHQDSENLEDDLRWLKVKCDAGADFIVTQLFYDLDGFEKWVRDVRSTGQCRPSQALLRLQKRHSASHHSRRDANSELCFLPPIGQPY